MDTTTQKPLGNRTFQRQAQDLKPGDTFIIPGAKPGQGWGAATTTIVSVNDTGDPATVEFSCTEMVRFRFSYGRWLTVV